MYIREKHTDIEIREALLCSLNLCDKKKVSEFMNTILPSDENENMNECLISYTSEEALALMKDADSSKSHYHMIDRQAKERYADINPAYDNLAIAK